MIRERDYAAMSGWAALVGLIAAAALSLWQMVENIKATTTGSSPRGPWAWRSSC